MGQCPRDSPRAALSEAEGTLRSSEARRFLHHAGKLRSSPECDRQPLPTNDHPQITTASLYSPNTRRIASEISPTVAQASTAARIRGITLAPERAASSTPASAT